MSDRNDFFRSIFNHPLFFRFVRAILDGGQLSYLKNFIASQGIRSIVDVGCGTGEYSEITDEAYLGIDYNENFIGYCRKRYPERKFLHADALTVSIDAKYDAVILVNALHHFSDAEAVRVLQKLVKIAGGYVIIHDVVPRKNPFSKLFYSIDRGAYMRTMESQLILLERAGLKSTKIEYMTTFPGIYRHSTILAVPFHDGNASISGKQ